MSLWEHRRGSGGLRGRVWRERTEGGRRILSADLSQHPILKDNRSRFHTKTFAEGASPVFFAALSFAFFTGLVLEPMAGRQRTAYTIWMIDSGRRELKSVGTGSATIAGKRR